MDRNFNVLTGDGCASGILCHATRFPAAKDGCKGIYFNRKKVCFFRF